MPTISSEPSQPTPNAAPAPSRTLLPPLSYPLPRGQLRPQPRPHFTPLHFPAPDVEPIDAEWAAEWTARGERDARATYWIALGIASACAIAGLAIVSRLGGW